MPGKAAYGMIVQFGTATGTTTSATLTNVTNISGLDGETEIIDVTSHDSGSAYREKVASFVDGGQVTIDVNFDPGDTTHQAASGGVIWLKTQRLVVPWLLKFPGTPLNSVKFNGIVKSTGIDAPFDDKLTMSIGIEVTGPTTWNYGT